MRGEASLFIRLAIVAGIVGTFAVLLGRSASPSNYQSGNAGIRDQAPSVFVESQAGSPLRIVIVEIQQTEQGTTELVFELKNVATKPIRAYTIQQQVTVGEKQRSETLFNDLSLSELSLAPGMSRREAAVVEVLDAKPTIALSVDFVEFSDGSAWGTDSSVSAERLKGQRAGFRFSANRLRETFRKEGTEGLSRALAENSALSAPTGHSPNYEAAFRVGGRIAVDRIKKRVEAGDMNQVEVLLNKSAKSNSAIAQR